VRLRNCRPLGLSIDTRRPAAPAIVIAVRERSALAAWNEACEFEKRWDHCVRPGDVVVEVNGLRIDSAKALRRQLTETGTEGEITFVFRREATTPAPGAASDEPLIALPAPSATPSSASGPVSIGTAAAKRYLASVAQEAEKEESERLLPGRWSRVDRPLIKLPQMEAPSPRGLPLRAPQPATSSFGYGPRFREAKEEDVVEAEHLCPTERFLSTKGTSRSAVIAPPKSVKPGQMRDAKRWLQKLVDEQHCDAAAVALTTSPGLRGITSAWQALLREESLASEEDDASTDVPSELSSELTSIWSSGPSEDSGPGPGAYNPDFGAVEPRAGRGVPSFSRYSARDKAQPEEEDSGSEGSAERDLPLPATGAHLQRASKGVKINPLPSTRLRMPSSSQQDADAAARRPFCYDGHAVEPAVPVPILGPGLDEGATMETSVTEPEGPGPGSYDLPVLVPGGRAAVIAPDSEISEIRQRARSNPPDPGPAHYDSEVSQIYPRAPSASFGPALGHSMEFQLAPDYVAGYEDLDVNWSSVLSRIPSALIPPEPSEEAKAAAAAMEKKAPSAGTGANLGPGAYDEARGDELTKRRPTALSWTARPNGVAEHLAGLFQEWTRRGRQIFDERPLLDPEADAAMRRRHPAALIQPEAEPVIRRSWAPGDKWRLYVHPTPEPEGLATFSRALDFDSWAAKEAQWQAFEARRLRREKSSSQLSYSLPDLHVIKQSAPRAVDFSLLTGRPASDGGDSPREGDVLILSANAELLHPRVPAPVDMDRQRGRYDGEVDQVDDFEELVLSPRPTQRRSPSYVDMARAQGRPQNLELDAHIWAEDPEHGVITYHPSSSLAARQGAEAEELDLEPAQAQNRLRLRALSADFERPLGRPGMDPRVDGSTADTPWGAGRDVEEDVVLTHWQEPFVAPPLPWRRGPDMPWLGPEAGPDSGAGGADSDTPASPS